MDKIKYAEGVLTINGYRYLMVSGSSLISRQISFDKNIYSVSYFKSLPEELSKVLADTYWVRLDTVEKTFAKSMEKPATVVGL